MIISGAILDLDGTIYRGDHLIPGAKKVIERLRNEGLKIVFLSNKALRTRADYADKLTKLGIPTEMDQVVNSSYVMAHWLSQESPTAAVYVIGEPPLVNELKRVGMNISSDPKEIEYVVASFDRDFHYNKLNIAYRAIKNGAHFVATNPDRTCPVEGGELPDAAGMIGAIEGVTGKKVESISGKPSKLMIKAALDRLGTSKDQCLLVGDRLETDIKMGNDVGIKTALVLTGVTSREDISHSPIKPDYVLESVAQLSELIPDGLYSRKYPR